MKREQENTHKLETQAEKADCGKTWANTNEMYTHYEKHSPMLYDC